MKLARYSNFTFRYTDDVLSLNNYKFDDFVDRVYPIEHEIKDTTNISLRELFSIGIVILIRFVPSQDKIFVCYTFVRNEVGHIILIYLLALSWESCAQG
jgi:hypothetical protein